MCLFVCEERNVVVRASLVRGRQGEVRKNNTSIVVFPADLKRFSRRESREISVVALARMFERSEFRSHTEQDERRCTRKSFTEDAFFGSFLLQKRNEQKEIKKRRNGEQIYSQSVNKRESGSKNKKPARPSSFLQAICLFFIPIIPSPFLRSHQQARREKLHRRGRI